MNSKEIDKEHVLKRLEDWKNRVSNLLDLISSWLENTNYTVKQGSNVQMFEILMKDFEIPPQNLPSIIVLNENRYVLSVKPKGLWIIGANGKLEILTLTSNFTIIDMAEQFENPIWKIYRSDRKKLLDFNKDAFDKVLTNQL